MITSLKLNIKDIASKYSEKAFIKELEAPKGVTLFNEKGTNFCISLNELSQNQKSQISEDVLFLKAILNKEAGKEIFFLDSEKKNKNKITISIDKDEEEIQNDGYIVDVKASEIRIFGKNLQGTVNGIYRFCEDFLGCMFPRDDYDYIPKLKSLYLNESRTINNPAFCWRHQYQYEVKQNNWYKKLQSNGSFDKLWGNCCHTCFTYVNPDIYFDEHPEYFSLVNGKRTKDQLCLSNPDIYPIISESANRLIESNPDALYWDFSINDNLNGCQCENCKAMTEKYGGFGPTLLILNRLAKEHPQKVFSTLAYFFSEDPPKNIKAEKNINVKLAPISSGQMYSFSLEGSEKAKKTKELISSWGKIFNSLYLWDYIVNFKHSLLPYPNFDVQRDNLKFYKENNVTQLFHQGCRDKSAELSCLRSYVMARQMWDFNIDIDSLIARYLNIVYGKAAPYIAEYLQLQNDLLKEKGKDLDLYENPKDHKDDYLSKEAVEKYRELIDKAFIAEKDNSEILYRLEEIKINVLYAQINVVGETEKNIRSLINEIKPLIEKHQIDRYNEWNKPTLEDFYMQNEKAINFRETAL